MIGLIVGLVLVAAAFLAVGIGIYKVLDFRTVVSTNYVHVVQSGKKTLTYGTGEVSGNVYYKWPSWLPKIGISVIELPVANFSMFIKDYEAYDKDRVPFLVDIASFFRIKDTGRAAQRIISVQQLQEQLTLIIQGAVRKILASSVIDVIMLERAQFGDAFTKEVGSQVEEWGLESVKSMELMDIRDSKTHNVIANIMAKKISHIEMESRVEVAKNAQSAKTSEIAAAQAVQVREQEAAQLVGQRSADKEKQIGISQQQAQQEILGEAKKTREAEMEVQRVNAVKTAEIEKDKQVVAAEQARQTQTIESEAELVVKTNQATGDLVITAKAAEGIKLQGAAKAEAETLILMAPVTAQTTLAKEIGENQGYQEYLIRVEQIKAYTAVGEKQAEALTTADIKVIVNSNSATAGMNSASKIFSSETGLGIASMVEAIASTPVGAKVLETIGVTPEQA